jgi:hypothetical protein
MELFIEKGRQAAARKKYCECIFRQGMSSVNHPEHIQVPTNPTHLLKTGSFPIPPNNDP